MVASDIIETVKNRLVKVYDPREVYLFGSFAWGQPEDESDLDLLIVVDTSDETFYKRPLPGLKTLFGLGIGSDIIVFTKEEFDRLAEDVSTLCYKIKHEGVKLYEAHG